MDVAAKANGTLDDEGQADLAARVVQPADDALTLDVHDAAMRRRRRRIARAGGTPCGAAKVNEREPHDVGCCSAPWHCIRPVSAATSSARTADKGRARGGGVAAPRSRGIRRFPSDSALSHTRAIVTVTPTPVNPPPSVYFIARTVALPPIPRTRRIGVVIPPGPIPAVTRETPIIMRVMAKMSSVRRPIVPVMGPAGPSAVLMAESGCPPGQVTPFPTTIARIALRRRLAIGSNIAIVRAGDTDGDVNATRHRPRLAAWTDAPWHTLNAAPPGASPSLPRKIAPVGRAPQDVDDDEP